MFDFKPVDVVPSVQFGYVYHFSLIVRLFFRFHLSSKPPVQIQPSFEWDMYPYPTSYRIFLFLLSFDLSAFAWLNVLAPARPSAFLAVRFVSPVFKSVSALFFPLTDDLSGLPVSALYVWFYL